MRIVAIAPRLLLCGCASPVTTSAQAIEIGMRACAEEDKDMPTSDWKAVLEGDHWRVWQGAENGNGPAINVARNGTRPNGYKDCAFIVVTD